MTNCNEKSETKTQKEQWDQRMRKNKGKELKEKNEKKLQFNSTFKRNCVIYNIICGDVFKNVIYSIFSFSYLLFIFIHHISFNYQSNNNK